MPILSRIFMNSDTHNLRIVLMAYLHDNNFSPIFSFLKRPQSMFGNTGIDDTHPLSSSGVPSMHD